MAIGRPPIYSQEILSKAREYIASCKDADKMVKIPTKGGLARFLDVSRDTLYDWAKNQEGFSDIMENLGAEQEDRLINNGLSGAYNPTIAKVLLTKHGYREGLEHTGKEGEALFNDEHKAKANKALDDILGQGNTEQGG